MSSVAFKGRKGEKKKHNLRLIMRKHQTNAY